jgi:hypothetical protein
MRRGRRRSLLLAAICTLAVVGAVDVALNVARVARTEYSRRATRAAADAVVPQESRGPEFIAENLSWRYIELFTMRPSLAAGPEYRMDSFGLRTSRDGRVSFDRYGELDCRKMWLFGGSTAMGLGLPADSTLPAQLQRRLNAIGRDPWCVFNLGMGSQESTQEVLLFYEMLQRGFRPEAVVFYDGINEAPYTRPAAGPAHTPIWRSTGLFAEHIRGINSTSLLARWKTLAIEASGLAWLAREVRQLVITRVSGAGDDATLVDRQLDTMVEHYRMNVRLLRGMAAELGIKAFFFWQPAMGYDRHLGLRELTPAEQRMWDAYGRPDEFRRHVAFTRLRQRTSFEEFPVFDVADVFRGVREQVYMDPRHPNSRGNALVAERLHAVLAERL